MGWAMLYLFVALKLPILAACLIIWWAVRQEPDDTGGDGGSRVRERPHPPAPLPRPPRRGPHGEGALPAPARVRRPAPGVVRRSPV